jgi:putative exporter of polyketide antibiotics
MVTIHTLHLLFIGIFFLTVSQVAPFQEQLLSFMLIIGIILVILSIIFRIVRVIGLKTKNAMGKTENHKQIPVSKNYYLTYFLIAIAFISILGGLMTMSSIP